MNKRDLENAVLYIAGTDPLNLRDQNPARCFFFPKQVVKLAEDYAESYARSRVMEALDRIEEVMESPAPLDWPDEPSEQLARLVDELREKLLNIRRQYGKESSEPYPNFTGPMGGWY